MHIQSNILAKEIRLGFPDDVGYRFINRVYNDFIYQNPNTSLLMNCDHSHNLFELFVNKQIDVCIIKELNLKKHIQPNYYIEDELVWIGSDSILETSLYSFKPLVLSPFPSVIRARALAVLEKNAIKNQVILSTINFASKISAVRDGLGISVIPASQAYDLEGIQVLSHLPSLGKIFISIYAAHDGVIENDLIMSIKKHMTDHLD